MHIGLTAVELELSIHAFPLWLTALSSPVALGCAVLVQIAMLAGFATAYPVDAWLIRRGIEERL